MPQVSMRQLLEAGVHFGHQTRRWNPKMRPYIFAERNGIHIIDLAQTVRGLENALEFVRETVARRLIDRRRNPYSKCHCARLPVVVARGGPPSRDARGASAGASIPPRCRGDSTASSRAPSLRAAGARAAGDPNRTRVCANSRSRWRRGVNGSRQLS